MRPTKSAIELQTMIMQEVRKHPDWGHVLDVTVTPTPRSASHLVNWNAGFTCEGPRMVPGAAMQMAHELANKYDLA